MVNFPTRYDWEQLQKFCSEVFVKTGLSQENADIVADSLVQANLRGVDSHGVVRTSIYLKRVEEGMINPLAEATVEQESDATALVNGNNSFGSIVGTVALEKAINKAKTRGAALVGVKGSNHFGTGAYYL